MSEGISFGDHLKDGISKNMEKMAKHKEEFAAAFLKKTGLDPGKVVMVTRSNGSFDSDVWFRPKTEDELEIDKRSETTIEQLRFCPVCPCIECQSRRKS